MRKPSFWITYVLLLVVQVLISNYCNFTPYLTLSILPVMVLCISIKTGTLWTMLIAFASGLLVDLLSEGILGLNALALVPVALLRNPLIRLFFGGALFAREEDFTGKNSDIGRIALAMLSAQALFLLVYIWADGAGMRPMWFNWARFGISLVSGFLLSIPTIGNLADPGK